MKSYILILMLLVSTQVIPQKLNDEFWGCKFGSNKEELINSIKLQEYIPIISERKIEINNVRYSDVDFDKAIFNFYLSKFYAVEFQTIKQNKKDINEIYEYLKDRLKDKYGYKKEHIEVYGKKISYYDSKTMIFLGYSKQDSNIFVLSLCYSNLEILHKISDGI